MSINLVQWEGSTVTPKLDAIMYDDGSYGIIKGCAITHQGTNLLKIANGFIKIAGRLIEIAEETIQCQVSASGTVNGQLWIRLDLSSVTPAVFMTEAAAVLTPLTQNADCNFQNGIYELQLATYNIDESVITNLVETAPELEKLRTALDNIDLAANKVTYDNTHSGLSANKVQGAIDEINDNLSGFKFYPTGTNLVALISDDSFYTDSDGKYVVWGTETAEQLVEDNPNTYKSVPSTEDCRGEVGADTVTPFKNKINTYGYGGTHASVNHLYEYEGIDFDVLYVHSCDVNNSSQSQRSKVWRRGENPTFTLEYYNIATNKYGTWTINVVSKNKFTYSLSTTDTSYVQSYGAHFDYSVAGY